MGWILQKEAQRRQNWSSIMDARAARAIGDLAKRYLEIFRAFAPSPPLPVVRSIALSCANSGWRIHAHRRLDVQAKTLVVPRAIRECVRELVTVEEIRELNRKAADLFFGSDWSQGIFKPPTSYRFDHPHCPAGDIANANAVVIRLFNDANTSDDSRGMQRALGLALSYVTALENGDHFQSVVNLCDQLLPNVAEDGVLAEQSDKLKASFGKCLRMIGASERALTILTEIEEHPLPSFTRLSILLNLALAHQSSGHEREAGDYARKVVAIDRHSNSALQAQTVLIELEVDGQKRSEKLEILADNAALLPTNLDTRAASYFRARATAAGLITSVAPKQVPGFLAADLNN